MASDPAGLLSQLLGTTGQGYNGMQQVQQDRQQAMGNQQALQLQQAKLNSIQQAAAQEKSYQDDVASYFADPRPERLSQLSLRYPEQAQAFQNTYKIMGDAQKQSAVTQFGGIYNAAKNGRSDLVSKLIGNVITAEKAQGIDTAEAEDLKAQLDGGDPKALTTALAFSQMHLAAADPSFAKAAGLSGDKDTHVINPGGSLVDNQGNELYHAQEKPEYKSLAPGEQLVKLDPAGGAAGGGAAPTRRMGWTPSVTDGGDNPPEAVSNKIAAVAQAAGIDPNAPLTRAQALSLPIHLMEGGAGTLADRNNNPGNIRNSDGSYKKFPTKEAGKNAQKALLGRFYDRGQRTITDIIAGKPVSGGGGSQVVAQGAAKPGYSLLAPTENKQLGLDPNVRYQRGPSGEITALGGQSKAQLKPLPGKAAEAITTNVSSINEIDQAIKLLDPSNKSKEAAAARYSIGASNRLIPDWVLQSSNPDGVDFRARIGKIGGVIIKDISGAAVSASEDNRLSKWVPMTTDTPAAALAKLKNLRRSIAQQNETITSMYSEDQGFRPFGHDAPASAPAFKVLAVRPK